MFRPGPSRLLGLLAATAVAGTSLLAVASPAQAAPLDLTQYVNPFIGTDDSNSPNPVPGGAGGSTVPGPVLPVRHGAVQPGHADRVAVGLPVQRHPDPGVQPDPLQRRGLPEQRGHRAPADHRQHRHLARHRLDRLPPPPRPRARRWPQAGYYKTVLSNYGNTQVELSATTRTGHHAPDLPGARRTAKVLINTSRSATGNRSGSITHQRQPRSPARSPAAASAAPRRRTRSSSGWSSTGRPTSVGTWLGGTVSAGSTSTSGVNSGGWLNFDTTSNPVVQVKVGISFVSLAGAQANLSAEQPGFDFAARPRQRRHRVEHDPQPGPGHRRLRIADLQKFYTALYHVLHQPEHRQRRQRPVPRLRQRHPHREPHRLPELLGLGHLPLVGGADRADRAGRGDRHRQVHGARRPAGRPAAQVVAQPQRALRHDRRPRARSSCPACTRSARAASTPPRR